MASAEQVTRTEEVVTTKEVTKIILELDQDEAQLIRDLIGSRIQYKGSRFPGYKEELRVKLWTALQLFTEDSQLREVTAVIW